MEKKKERHFDDERCPKCDSKNISWSSYDGLKCQDCGYTSKHPLILN